MARVSDRDLFLDVALLDFEDPTVRARASAADGVPRVVRNLRWIVTVLGFTGVLVAASRLGPAVSLAVLLILVGVAVALVRRTRRAAPNTA